MICLDIYVVMLNIADEGKREDWDEIERQRKNVGLLANDADGRITRSIHRHEF